MPEARGLSHIWTTGASGGGGLQPHRLDEGDTTTLLQRSALRGGRRGKPRGGGSGADGRRSARALCRPIRATRSQVGLEGVRQTAPADVAGHLRAAHARRVYKRHGTRCSQPSMSLPASSSASGQAQHRTRLLSRVAREEIKLRGAPRSSTISAPLPTTSTAAVYALDLASAAALACTLAIPASASPGHNLRR